MKKVLSNSLTQWPFGLFLGVFVLLLDFGTKWLVVHFLPLHGDADMMQNSTVVIFENFFGIKLSLTHTVNTGAAWGFFSEYSEVLLLFRIFFITGIIVYLSCCKVPPSWRLPFILIIAGATGNVIDYFLYGSVVDMIHFVFWGYNYPVFNVADSAIFIGTFSLLWITLFKKDYSHDTLSKQ